MIHKRTHLLLSAALIAATTLSAGCGGGIQPQDEPIDAMAFAAQMGMGWNLGNSFDSYANGKSDEMVWGNGKATQKTFDEVAAKGFGCVRIPVTWFGHIGKAPEYKLDDKWLERIREVALYAHNAGLKVIINIHHDGLSGDGAPAERWIDIRKAAASEEADEAVKAKLSALWKQVATHFKDEGDWLIFETMNEVHDGGWGSGDNVKDGGKQYGILNSWNQVCLDAIRSAGGKNAERFVAVVGYSANAHLTAQHLALPEDSAKNRLMVAFHIYDPWDFAGSAKYDEWGHTGRTGNMAPESLETDFTAKIDGLYNKYVTKGIPVYAGECGCVRHKTAKGERFRRYYIEYTIKAMRERGIVPIVWDNGKEGSGEENFGLLRHSDGQPLGDGDEIIALMNKAWSTTDPEYTLTSISKRAPTE